MTDTYTDGTERDLEQLGEEWGYVVVTHRPSYDDDFRWVVANHTDEGLGPGENVEARGETLREAVDNALEGNYYEWYTDTDTEQETENESTDSA